MKITNIEIRDSKYQFAIDFSSIENFVVINNKYEIIRNNGNIPLDDKITRNFLKIKMLSNDEILIIDGDPQNVLDDNAWIINSSGAIQTSFYVGSVHKITTTSDYIICSYGESGIDSGREYDSKGLVVFDKKGNSKYEMFDNGIGGDYLDTWTEIYAFLENDDNSIYYMPFGPFKIVKFNLIDFTSRIVCNLPESENHVPETFWNPKAFSKKGNNWYFVSPDLTDLNNLKSGIFKMDNKMKIEQIANCQFSNTPIGLKNGKFAIPISIGNNRKKDLQFVEL